MTNPAQIAATCQTCRFWARDNLQGQCRRYPPKVVLWTHPDLPGAQYDQLIPWTGKDDFCGEHRPKEQTDGE